MPIQRPPRLILLASSLARAISGALYAPQPSAVAATPAHSQRAYAPASNFTMKWTRADALNILDQSNANVTPGANSLPTSLTMPEIPGDFP